MHTVSCIVDFENVLVADRDICVCLGIRRKSVKKFVKMAIKFFLN